LLQTHPAVDEVIVFRRGHGVAPLIEFLRAVRASRPELTLDLQRHFKSGLTSLCSAAPRRLGFHWRNSREGNRLFNTESIEPVRDYTPKLSHFMRFADHLSVPPTPVSFGLAAGCLQIAHCCLHHGKSVLLMCLGKVRVQFDRLFVSGRGFVPLIRLAGESGLLEFSASCGFP
jgi:ADP-heptose:LPS heptosyltransferase